MSESTKRANEIHYQNQQAYTEANVVDKIINELLGKYPVETNPHFWFTFCRTIESGLGIIRRKARRVVMEDAEL